MDMVQVLMLDISKKYHKFQLFINNKKKKKKKKKKIQKNIRQFGFLALIVALSPFPWVLFFRRTICPGITNLISRLRKKGF